MAGNVQRMRALAVCGAAALATQAHGREMSLRAAPDGRALTLTFSDEFNHTDRSDDPSPRLWRTTFGDGHQLGLDRRSLPTNHELEIYVDSGLSDPQGNMGLDPFRIHDGYLDITARPTPAALVPRLRSYPYVSGLISSQPSFSQAYGYFEMRAEVPGGKGVWPAFWLLPADQSWPPEIDVMESVGDPSVVYTAVHSTVEPAKGGTGHIAPGEFHTFAVSWDSSNVIFYADGRQIDQEPTPPDMNKPMFMLANLAIGGDWPGAPDAATQFPVKFRIDYIRAYRFAHD